MAPSQEMWFVVFAESSLPLLPPDLLRIKRDLNSKGPDYPPSLICCCMKGTPKSHLVGRGKSLASPSCRRREKLKKSSLTHVSFL